MSVALGGNLKDFGIAEVFQLIGQQQKTGMLEITAGKRTIRLAFDAGAVVWASPVGPTQHAVLGERLVRTGLMTQERLHALIEEGESSARPLPSLVVSTAAVTQQELDEAEELLTRETIFDLLRWSDGSFHFSAQTVRHDRPPETLLAAEQILMDGLRMIDEWRTFADRIPGDEVIYQQLGPLDVYRQRARGDAKRRLPLAERVYQLIDGRLTTRRIIDLSRLGTFEATRILAEFVDAGVIGALDKDQTRKARRAELAQQPMSVRVGGVLATALPLALLCLMVSFVMGALVPIREPLPGFHIVREPLLEARETFEKRRLRYGLQRDRFLDGAWPQSLTELSEESQATAGLLATPGAGSYYYRRSGDGVTVLAPER